MTQTQLRKFCGGTEDNNRHYVVNKTFVKNGWRYATDCRIAVRIRTDASDTKRKNIPPIEGIFRKFTKGRFLAYPPLSIRASPEKVKVCAVGKQWIKLKYDKLIRPLRNVRYAPGGKLGPRFNGSIRFIFDGGQGIVMPFAMPGKQTEPKKGK